ncbi:MAG: acylphosphatase [Phycisphaerae bacterium]
MVQKTVLFSGRVQGVGFRYITHTLSNDYQVTGYVKNLPDGRVEAVIEGDQLEIDRFINAIQAEMEDHIQEIHVTESPVSGQYEAFDVRF